MALSTTLSTEIDAVSDESLVAVCAPQNGAATNEIKHAASNRENLDFI